MNYVPLTRDERTHEIKKLGEFNVLGIQCFAIISIFRDSFMKDHCISVVMFIFQVLQLFSILLLILPSVRAPILLTFS